MQHFRYNLEGLKSTNPIAKNFKTLDAYEQVGDVIDIVEQGQTIKLINAKKAASMKTTKTSDVTSWLTAKMKTHIDAFAEGAQNNGIFWNKHRIKYTEPRLNIYMPKEIIDSAKQIWLERLNEYAISKRHKIKFDIRTLEEFIK